MLGVSSVGVEVELSCDVEDLPSRRLVQLLVLCQGGLVLLFALAAASVRAHLGGLALSCPAARPLRLALGVLDEARLLRAQVRVDAPREQVHIFVLVGGGVDGFHVLDVAPRLGKDPLVALCELRLRRIEF